MHSFHWAHILVPPHSAASQAQCEDRLLQDRVLPIGSIIVRGVTTSNFTAGRIEVCIESQFRSVCADNWGDTEVRIACRQLGGKRTDAQLCKEVHIIDII